MKLSPLGQRRWRNFRSNRRAYWSLIIFSVIFVDDFDLWKLAIGRLLGFHAFYLE